MGVIFKSRNLQYAAIASYLLAFCYIAYQMVK